MIERHNPDLQYYAGARAAFVEMQKHLHKLLERIAVYEAETVDDWAKANEANATTERLKEDDRTEIDVNAFLGA